MSPQSIIFDMETGDPDDALALCILATHPEVSLKAVTVFPGGPDQVGLARYILRRLGKESVPVGAGTPKGPSKGYVSGFHKRWLGNTGESDPDASAKFILSRRDNHDTHLVTGGPLTNVLAGLRHYQPTAPTQNFFAQWTLQGGFVGTNLMDPRYVLPKFEGRVTCPTWNLGGNPDAARTLLEPRDDCGPNIPVRRMVPKSVCHGVVYTSEVDRRIPRGAHPGLDLFKDGMAVYFERRPEGKALHDVIAVAAAIRPSIGRWATVRPYCQNGEWGCEAADTSIHAMLKLDLSEFERTLAQ